jgi:CheY-like chemotaxis protein
VIGLSANSDTESIDCVAAAGMDNFIAKPLKVSTLRKVCGPQKAL